jgi:acetyl esterase/lipase
MPEMHKYRGRLPLLSVPLRTASFLSTMAGRAPDAVVCYKTVKIDSLTVPVLFDAYLPPSLVPKDMPAPAVIYFHGGGMTVGNRQAWFPKWFYGEKTSEV